MTLPAIRGRVRYLYDRRPAHGGADVVSIDAIYELGTPVIPINGQAEAALHYVESMEERSEQGTPGRRDAA